MLETDLLEEKLQKEDLFEAYEIASTILEKKYDLDVAYKMGIICSRIGKVNEALSFLKEYQRNGGKEAFAALNVGHMNKALGDFSSAASDYKQFIESHPSMAGTGWWHLSDLKDFKVSDQELEQLESQCLGLNEANPDKMLMSFALGNYFERKNKFKKALHYFSEANAGFSKSKPFNAAIFHKLIKDLETLKAVPKYNFNCELIPIFILGMPRSGSTLCEQILSSHSQVSATDELPFINSYAAGMERSGSYAQALVKLSIEQASDLRAQYLNNIKRYGVKSGRYFIDKSPINFLHVGLIKCLFPESIIINTYRDCLDNALSIFKRFFYQGNEYAYNLDSIAVYMSGYLRLMRVWEGLFPNEILHCRYESLVAHNEKGIRELLAHCQLDIEEACLHFYEQKRAVLTPSVDQVTKPLYTSAIGSWKKYEPYIDEKQLKKFQIVQQHYKLQYSIGTLGNPIASWTDYWSTGNTTSFHQSSHLSYDGEIKNYWLNKCSVFEQGENVLDLCTGNGALPLLFIDMIRAGNFKVTGVDSAQVNLQIDEMEGLQLLSGVSIQNLPFESANFDVLVSQFGIEYSDLERSVPEMSRVLRSGGSISLVCHWWESQVVLENKAIFNCTNEIQKNALFYLGEMLQGLDFAFLGDATQTETEYFREKLNIELGRIQNLYKDVLFQTGFPDQLKSLLKFKNTGESYFRYAEYSLALMQAQVRLKQMFEAALNEEKIQGLITRLAANNFENIEVKDLRQQGRLVAKIIEARKK